MARINEFKPHGEGLEKVLGGLEAEIMETAWRLGRCTVRDVHVQLREQKDLAYTTVMTVMSRLATKGLLKREMVDGSYYYEASLSKPDFERSMVAEVLDSLLESFSEHAIAHLVRRVGSDGDQKRLEELARVIDEKRRERKT